MESLRDCFVDSFLKQGHKKAVAFLRNGRVETELSYRELDRDSSRLANVFRDLKVGKGDRVILLLPKSLFFIAAHIALQKIGAVAVPLNPGFKEPEMAYFVADSGATLIVSGTDEEAVLKEIGPGPRILVVDAHRPYQDTAFFRSASDERLPVEIGPEDPGLIIYTSGTTGQPKGAVLTQRNLVHDARNIIKAWGISGSDVLCHALPLFHIHGLCFALHTSLIAGSRVLMLDRFSPETVLGVLGTKGGGYACTVFMAVPTMYLKMMDVMGDKTIDLDHVRLWTSGSAPLPPQDFEMIKRAFGKEPVEREGMSETGMNFSNPVRGVRKPGSIGLPLPELEVRIVNPETFQDVQPGQTGEIWLKGPGVTPGYWRKPEETAKAFKDGWFRTGDLGKRDADGYYYLTDRLKHVIISGGENVSPKEIESVINELGGVVESSVVGIPDQTWGEKIAAAVVTRPDSGLAPGDIKAHCKERLHDWKCPKDVVFVKALPKNTMGKVLKDEVKKAFAT